MAAVESIRAQSDPQWRLTVVDDVYPDLAPGEWVKSIADDRISYSRNAANLGVAGNFNASVSLMTSDWGVVMGGDDIMLPGFVARVRELALGHPTAAVIQPGVEVIDEAGGLHLPLVDRLKGYHRFRGAGVRTFAGEQLATSLLRGNWTYFPSLVWRVEVLRQHRFRPDLVVAPDLVMLLDITADGGSLVLDEATVFQYRRHRHSVSSAAATDGSRFAEEHGVFIEQADRFARMGWKRAAGAARAHVSSRLNALTRVPAAIANGDGHGLRMLVSHAAGRAPAPR